MLNKKEGFKQSAVLLRLLQELLPLHLELLSPLLELQRLSQELQLTLLLLEHLL